MKTPANFTVGQYRFLSNPGGSSAKEEEEEEEEEKRVLPLWLGVFPKPEADSFVCAGISPAGGDLKTVLCAERVYFPKQSKTEKFWRFRQ